jgi:hypothetical protein
MRGSAEWQEFSKHPEEVIRLFEKTDTPVDQIAKKFKVDKSSLVGLLERTHGVKRGGSLKERRREIWESKGLKFKAKGRKRTSKSKKKR